MSAISDIAYKFILNMRLFRIIEMFSNMSDFNELFNQIRYILDLKMHVQQIPDIKNNII